MKTTNIAENWPLLSRLKNFHLSKTALSDHACTCHLLQLRVEETVDYSPMVQKAVHSEDKTALLWDHLNALRCCQVLVLMLIEYFYYEIPCLEVSLIKLLFIFLQILKGVALNLMNG